MEPGAYCIGIATLFDDPKRKAVHKPAHRPPGRGRPIRPSPTPRRFPPKERGKKTPAAIGSGSVSPPLAASLAEHLYCSSSSSSSPIRFLPSSPTRPKATRSRQSVPPRRHRSPSPPPLLFIAGEDDSPEPEQLPAAPSIRREADSAGAGACGSGDGGAGKLSGPSLRCSRRALPRVHARYEGNSNNVA